MSEQWSEGLPYSRLPVALSARPPPLALLIPRRHQQRVSNARAGVRECAGVCAIACTPAPAPRRPAAPGRVVDGAAEARAYGEQAADQAGHEVLAGPAGHDGVVGAAHARAVVGAQHDAHLQVCAGMGDGWHARRGGGPGCCAGVVGPGAAGSARLKHDWRQFLSHQPWTELPLLLLQNPVRPTKPTTHCAPPHLPTHCVQATHLVTSPPPPPPHTPP